MAGKKKGKKKKAEEMPVGEILPEFKEIPKVLPKVKFGKKGVYAKVKATEKFVGDVGTSVRKLQSDHKAQERENADAVRKIGDNVSKQTKENESAVRKINVGVKEIQGSMEKKARDIERGAKEIQAGIKAQARENEACVKDFYYG